MSSADPVARQVLRVRVALVAGLVVAAGLLGALALGAPPVRFSGTAVMFSCSAPCYPPDIPRSTQSFSAGAYVSFDWHESNGTTGALEFIVSGPLGNDFVPVVFSGIGTTGSGAFVSSGGTYWFLIQPDDHQLGYIYATYAGTG